MNRRAPILSERLEHLVEKQRRHAGHAIGSPGEIGIVMALAEIERWIGDALHEDERQRDQAAIERGDAAPLSLTGGQKGWRLNRPGESMSEALARTRFEKEQGQARILRAMHAELAKYIEARQKELDVHSGYSHTDLR